MQLKRLHEYQKVARDFNLDRFGKKPGSGNWLECGLGKTIVSLKTIEALIEYKLIKRALIVAPARVIATSWPKEIEEWGLDLSWEWLQTSNREQVAASKSDIVFVGSENLALRTLSPEVKAKRTNPQLAEWMLKAKLPFDIAVVDEVTKFKTWTSSRSRVLQKLIRGIPNRITLTGTPTPNSLIEVFPQHYLLDEGETLSPHIGKFRAMYAQPCGHKMRSWEIRPDKEEDLLREISPWYLSQQAVDHLDMPKLVRNKIEVILPSRARKIYTQMHQEMVAELEGDFLVALAGGSRYNFCRQIASGCTYSNEKEVVDIHNAKLDALEGLVDELNGKPLVVAYWYQHEVVKLKKRFPNAAVIMGGVSAAKTKQVIDAWKTKQIPLLLCQASAISHGVDGLQHGGNDMCWYTLTDNPDIRYQFERRIYRQGVKGQVRIHYLLAKSTVDATILRVLDRKGAKQEDVLQAIKELGNAAE